MRLSQQSSRAGRGGFTLIELLVVIAIIGILVSLTAAAVIKTLVTGTKATVNSELRQLDGGVQAFQSQYNVSAIPSRIWLRKYLKDYFSDQNPLGTNYISNLDRDSVTYLSQVFATSGQKFKANWISPGYNWHSSWSASAASQSQLLEGDQCLVFFLGGIQTTGPNGCLGFSTDNSHPDQLGGDRRSFFDFKSARLVVSPSNGNTVFLSYQDAWGKGKPYAYFSAYARDNNYNPYGTSDCVSLGVWPYAESLTPTPRFLKKNTFQIISAGADGVFGPGTVMTQGNAAYVWTAATAGSIAPAGKDDQTNFAQSVLAAGQ